MPTNYIRPIINLLEEAPMEDSSRSEENQRAFNRAMEEYLVYGTAILKFEVLPKQKKIKRNLPDWF